MNTFTIYVENNELYEQYQERAKSHNENCNTSLHYDAGFDILTPQEIDCPPLCATKLNSNIVATLYIESAQDAGPPIKPIIQRTLKKSIINVYKQISNFEEFDASIFGT